MIEEIEIENNEELLERLSVLISTAVLKIEENALEIDSLNQVNKSLEEFAANESKSKLELIEDKEILKAKLDNLAGNNSYYTDLVKSLELNIEQNSHYRIEYELIREKYEKMLLENAELKEKVNTIPILNEKITEHNNRINELELLNHSYLNTIGKYEKALTDKELIQKDLASKNIRIYELLNDIQDQKEKLIILESKMLRVKDNDKLMNNYKLIIKDLEGEILGKNEEFNSINYQLSVENAQLKDELNNSKIEIGNVENEKSILENKNQEQIGTINQLKSEIIELNTKINDIKLSYDKLNLEIDRLNKINSNYTQEFDLIKSNEGISQKELKIAKDEIIEINNYNNELMEEIERLETVIKTNKNQISELIEDSKNLKLQIEEVKIENNNAKESNGRYEVEIDNLKSELNSAQNQKIIEYSIKIDELERLNTDLEFQLEEKSNELSQKVRDIKLLQERMAEFIHETNELKSGLAELNVKISIYNNNENKYLSRINNLEDLVKTRYEQINLLENKINNLLDEKNQITETKKALIEMVKSTINEVDEEIISLKSK